MTSTIACRTTFAALPEEMIVKILEWCDFKDVLACQVTCRSLRDVIVASISLRYKLALTKHGMCDGTTSKLSTAEKLEMLTAHAHVWQSLDMACPEKVNMLVGWSAPIAVSGNVMVFSRRSSRQLENHQGKWSNKDAQVMAMTGPRLNLLVLRVPSALRRVEAAHWVLDLPGNVSEVSIDASQNLLIYLSCGMFYPCMLSSEASHPLAKCGGYFRMWDGEVDWRCGISNLCVCGDFVAGVTRVYFISIWNWKTGKLVSDQLMAEVSFSSFDFFDEYHILYSASTEDNIYIYDWRRGRQPLKEKEKDTGILRFHLDLPPINRATTSRYIQIRRNALPTITGRPPDWKGLLEDNCVAPEPNPATPPFYADPHERLIVMRIATSPVKWGEEQFELHVPAQALLEHFSSSAATSDTEVNRQRDVGGECEEEEDSEVLVIPWTAWRNAVHTTTPRKLPYMAQSRMIVYGMRVVSNPLDWDESAWHVYSYPPRARRRKDGREAGRDTAEAVETEPVAGARESETRQSIVLPRELLDESDIRTALCEDALLCYKVEPLSSKISHAYWYTF